jgi:hypothetical protein
MSAQPLLAGQRAPASLAVAVAAVASVALLAIVSGVAGPSALLARQPQMLYGGHHWGGVGSEGYGTKQWDNTGWNAHYHPRDGASMDSESMEPYTWRKGPRVNDEYVFNDGGDPTVDPGKSWEPPIMVNGHEVYKAGLQSLAGVPRPQLELVPVVERQGPEFVSANPQMTMLTCFGTCGAACEAYCLDNYNACTHNDPSQRKWQYSAPGFYMEPAPDYTNPTGRGSGGPDHPNWCKATYERCKKPCH